MLCFLSFFHLSLELFLSLLTKTRSNILEKKSSLSGRGPNTSRETDRKREREEFEAPVQIGVPEAEAAEASQTNPRDEAPNDDRKKIRNDLKTEAREHTEREEEVSEEEEENPRCYSSASAKFENLASSLSPVLPLSLAFLQPLTLRYT